MDESKTLGFDGHPMELYKENWEIVGDDLLSLYKTALEKFDAEPLCKNSMENHSGKIRCRNTLEKFLMNYSGNSDTGPH